MKKFAVRSDMEGLFGVMSWGEVVLPAVRPTRKPADGCWMRCWLCARGLREGGR